MASVKRTYYTRTRVDQLGGYSSRPEMKWNTTGGNSVPREKWINSGNI